MRDVKKLKLAIEKNLIQPMEKISLVDLVDSFVEYAYASGASDVHIHPESDGIRLRFRIDGLLQDIFEKGKVSQTLHQEIITRIKVMSGLRTDEHLSPQDGRFKINVKDFGDIDVRVSIMPTYHGENAVLRILAESHSYTLNDLGFSEKDFAKVERAIKRPYGMILANGPTGSGKTTTLYTILKELNNPQLSIITIEDPIEYSLAGTTQTQVNAKSGLTFASGLRSILRQDPNIVMVGEIRDDETASISVNAALTGHLVLSTLHTNDSATTFPRLIDIGVPPFLIASTVNIAMGQRLIRKICEACKTERTLTDADKKSIADMVPESLITSKVFYVGKGCDKCNSTGYSGRIAIRELLEVDDDIRELVAKRASAQEIKNTAIKNGMTTMLMDGAEKASKGITTLEEVIRIIHE
jgi:type II secretory ATPase GspE/PulE/Tfp pilus assembly ATPase PilB-like protein